MPLNIPPSFQSKYIVHFCGFWKLRQITYPSPCCQYMSMLGLDLNSLWLHKIDVFSSRYCASVSLCLSQGGVCVCVCARKSICVCVCVFNLFHVKDIAIVPCTWGCSSNCGNVFVMIQEFSLSFSNPSHIIARQLLQESGPIHSWTEGSRGGIIGLCRELAHDLGLISNML